MESKAKPASFPAALVSGGMAGFAVDVSLYPLDTLKTRLQSPQGFIKAGGFRGVYSGLGVAAVGSAPGAALFFSSYEMLKKHVPQIYTTFTPSSSKKLPDPVVHMVSASIGEVCACLIRVPTETVKQKYQAKILLSSHSLLGNLTTLFREEGMGGYYRGFFSTIMREIPFALIQFPLYEWLKVRIATQLLRNERDLRSYEAAFCGSVSGGFAAACTTPLDVIKTRLMLGRDRHGVAYRGFADTIGRLRLEGEMLAQESGRSVVQAQTRIFFSGLGPRVMWISIGGFVFFGAYEQALRLTQTVL